MEMKIHSVLLFYFVHISVGGVLAFCVRRMQGMNCWVQGLTSHRARLGLLLRIVTPSGNDES
jgi:hypothetical protein